MLFIFLQVGVGDPVSGDQGQVHGNNHHDIPSQHYHAESVDMEPDTTLSLALSTGVFISVQFWTIFQKDSYSHEVLLL
jgi:hypothetical protein